MRGVSVSSASEKTCIFKGLRAGFPSNLPNSFKAKHNEGLCSPHVL